MKLFLQSLPPKSYQIIGFGTRYLKYDLIPKEYKEKNISEVIRGLEKLNANLKSSIYTPLKEIYDSNKIYSNINLQKYIILLTDSKIKTTKITLSLIEKNNNKFKIISIGLGNSFDEDLVRSAGIKGKGKKI